ncbi:MULTISPECIES: DUF3566 domain-containing protein [unclassified Archaeoglobus]|jgi:phosphotransferase system  glucose/maltose/N-acetylglucosamine-specific IIC component|uniref:DUF3566 domain-containing protein n=1 Tax=unclassified Archaeoglobus TaxID=2643606 RepID=UPI0025BDFC13|nr:MULTISPECIES: DUF3566 domain-containing protein [unclassified Archaeoglobus]
MFEIKRLGLLSMAKIGAVFMAIIGLISIVGLTISKGGSFNPVVLVLVPLTYAVVGFVLGAVLAFLYNIVARFIGGMKIELEKADESFESDELEFDEEESEFTQT